MSISLRSIVLVCLLSCCLTIQMMAHSQSSSSSSEIEKLIHDIAGDIKLYRFALAQEEILDLGDNNKIALIIHNVYENLEESFNLILDFVKALTRVDLSFYVLQALSNEMKANGHTDPLKMISLVRAFENHVVFQKYNDKIIEAKSKEIIKETKADIKSTSKKILTAAMISNSYINNYRVESVAENIFNFFYDLHDEIMREMVNETYPIVPAGRIAETIMLTSKFIPQKVSVFLALFEKLEKNDDLNNEGVLKIANYINQIREEDNYANLFRHQKYEVNLMIDKIPTCARNLYFAEEVCIWNRGRLEYLYAPRLTNNSTTQRSVYTTVPEMIETREGSWVVEPLYDDKFSFKSQSHKREYLDASVEKYNLVTRHVLTREKIGTLIEERSAWSIDLIGEYCYIRNDHFIEYLFASDKMHDERERYVFTANSQDINIDPIYFQWQIRDCR